MQFASRCNMISCLGWTIGEWLQHYREQSFSVRDMLQPLRESLDAKDPAWIYIVSAEELEAQIANLPEDNHLPLYGIPFAVKDNIDVAGLPTTAACPAFTYVPSVDATCVALLKKAGAIVLGKTNLDQFATGLVGTRSPYGAVTNPFNENYISGGSSSGSATCVAKGSVPFSLGTDTAGSGRVPAGFNNIVGLKPTKGRFSTQGVVPACRTLDCVSIFALTLGDAELVANLLQAFDATDGYSRTATHAPRLFSHKPRIAIPAQLQWFGDQQAEAAWHESLAAMQALGVDIIALDFSPMFKLANLLYGDAWVAERYAAVGDFLQQHGEDMNPVVRGIIEKATAFSAADVFKAEYQRAQLTREIQLAMSEYDAFLVPTAPYHPTIAQVNDDPVVVNSHMGTYTNFVNFADLSALALPAGFRADGLPFGITLIAPAWQDAALVEFGQRWQNARALPLGITQRPLPSALKNNTIPADYIRIAVVGAHLTGMPLNYQLQERHARFVEATTTQQSYRLLALANTTPPKPGLQRLSNAQTGAEIAVELWDLPLTHFGSFVAFIPAPLGIGTITLKDGREVKGFICEGSALEGATDITHFGGWRAYLNSLQSC